VHDTHALFQTGFQLVRCGFRYLTAARQFGHLLYRPFQVDPFLPTRLRRPWQRTLHNIRACGITSLSIVAGNHRPDPDPQEHHLSLVAIFANPGCTAGHNRDAAGGGRIAGGSISGSVAVCLNNTVANNQTAPGDTPYSYLGSLIP
jgi:hypothetical protein